MMLYIAPRHYSVPVAFGGVDLDLSLLELESLEEERGIRLPQTFALVDGLINGAQYFPRTPRKDNP